MNVEMTPSAGANAVRFVGDSFRIELRTDQPAAQAFVRTNVGRAGALHAEIVQEYREELARWKLPAIAGAETTRPRGLAWRDIPMTRTAEGWRLDLAIAEPGFFQAKAYAIDNQGRQSWPAGANAGISAHPNEYRSGNTIYCAFTRMFGETRHAASTISEIDPHLARLDKLGYAVIPASGKLRDLARELPHIFETLGCRILHLLPVTPTPTTYARFGRFGSPYATQDLTAIDPALVEFDRRTTGIDQFCELATGVHQRQGRLVLDVVLNHTGWGSTLLEQHPEWFLRHENGVFASPGAGDFFHQQAVRQARQAHAAVGLGNLGVHQAQVPRLPQNRDGKLPLFVELASDGGDLCAREVAGGLAQRLLLFGKRQIEHLAPFISCRPITREILPKFTPVYQIDQSGENVVRCEGLYLRGCPVREILA